MAGNRHGQRPGGQLLGFTGLYECWLNPTRDEGAEDKGQVTATILTRTAHDALEHIGLLHHQVTSDVARPGGEHSRGPGSRQMGGR